MTRAPDLRAGLSALPVAGGAPGLCAAMGPAR